MFKYLLVCKNQYLLGTNAILALKTVFNIYRLQNRCLFGINRVTAIKSCSKYVLVCKNQYLLGINRLLICDSIYWFVRASIYPINCARNDTYKA